MSNSETIESEIRAELCATVSCRFSRSINQAELGRNCELSSNPRVVDLKNERAKKKCNLMMKSNNFDEVYDWKNWMLQFFMTFEKFSSKLKNSQELNFSSARIFNKFHKFFVTYFQFCFFVKKIQNTVWIRKSITWIIGLYGQNQNQPWKVSWLMVKPLITMVSDNCQN